jgi:two-component sensor histidine kinase
MTSKDGPTQDPKPPVVEQSPDGDQPQLSNRNLRLRIRQQEILAELGVVALQRTAFRELIDSTVKFAAEGLEADLCKVLEYIPEDNRFLLRAGIGWNPGLIDVASVGADLESPAGFALHTGRPVISNHLENEERFRTPDLLKVHGVRRAINVILQGDGAAFGVLEVDSRSEGEFTEQDIAFLQGLANMLGMAIERQRYERNLREALAHQKVLVSEINHRVKNSLQLVASMFGLQASTSEDPGLVQSLQEATGRVTAVARVHERLYQSSDVLTVDLTAYLKDICGDLSGITPNTDIQYECKNSIRISTDRAVNVALLVTELVTNAAKHAYPTGGHGEIKVRVNPSQNKVVVISVRDYGSGISADFNAEKSTGLGMRIVTALIKQLGATLEIRSHKPGTEFLAEVPLQSE